MKAGVPEGGLTIAVDEQGRFHANLTLHIATDVTPVWLDIAVSHAIETEQRHAHVLDAWSQPDDDALVAAMEAEAAAAMECSLASAVALDAFYSLVKRDSSFPASLTDIWRKKRTARHRQVVEVLRRSFKVTSATLKHLQTNVKEVFRFRDLAVHPPARLQPPLWYEDLRLSTEWRFIYFRWANARLMCQAALSTVSQLVACPKNASALLKDTCDAAAPRVRLVVARWEARYGNVLDLPGQAASDHAI